MKKLLLVGASGFLGQHIKKHYENIGWKVFTLGRNFNSDYKYIDKDLNSILDIRFDIQFDRLIHTAAINEVDISKDLQETYAVNVTLSRILIELARNIKISEFVYISTFHVYGIAQGKVDENNNINPLNDYGLTHYLSEKIVTDLGLQYGVTTLCVRPTNIYGQPVDMSSFNRWTLVPFAFPRSAIDNGNIIIRSSGLQLRNFVSVDDVIRSIDLIGKQCVVNAFGRDTLTIRELALQVSDTFTKQFSKKCEVSWEESNSEGDTGSLFVTNSFEEYQPKDCISSFIAEFLGMIEQ